MGKVYVSLVGAVFGGLAGILHLVGNHTGMISPASAATCLVAIFLACVGLIGGYMARWYRRPGAGTLIVAGVIGLLSVSTYFIPAAVFFIITGIVIWFKKAPADERVPI